MNDPTVQNFEENKCLNCDELLVGPYCHNCGQNSKYRRLDMRQLIGNFFQNLFNLDAAYPKTFIGLIRHPGIVCRQYVAGMRRRYANPFGYLIVAFALHVFLNATIIKHEVPPVGGFLTLMSTTAIGAFVESFKQAHTEAEGSDLDKPSIDLNSITAFTNKYSTWLTCALIVPLALIWAILFRKAQYNLAENYVFALYILGQLTLLGLVPIFIVVALTNSSLIGRIVDTLLLAIIFPYFVYAGKGFYQQKWFTVVLKFVASFVILTIFELVVGTLGVIIWSRFG